MVTITFPDVATEQRAVPLMRGPFAARALGMCRYSVPEEALAALADQNIQFTVLGKTNGDLTEAERRAKAIALLQKWIDEAKRVAAAAPDDGYDFLQALNENRVRQGERPLFPPEMKGISW